jgi:5-methylcytosine-specific restriction endonuclease McrA
MSMVGVLILNASYEPLHVIDYRRALTLLASDKAELIARTQDGRELCSPSARLPVPSVIRLRRYVNVPQRGATWSKQGVFARDKWTCVYCGEVLTPKTVTIDHVLPQWYCKRNNIHPNTWANTVTACRTCQSKKGGRLLHETGIKFHDPNYEPRRPRANYLVLTWGANPEWREYIPIT